jgi:hypothetical protein
MGTAYLVARQLQCIRAGQQTSQCVPARADVDLDSFAGPFSGFQLRDAEVIHR